MEAAAAAASATSRSNCWARRRRTALVTQTKRRARAIKPTTEKTPATAAVFWKNLISRKSAWECGRGSEPGSYDLGAVVLPDAAGASVSVGEPSMPEVMVMTPLPEVVTRNVVVGEVVGAVTGGGTVDPEVVVVEAVIDADASVVDGDEEGGGGMTGVVAEEEVGGGTALVSAVVVLWKAKRR